MLVTAIAIPTVSAALVAVTWMGLRFAARALLLEKMSCEDENAPVQPKPIGATEEERALALERTAAELRRDAHYSITNGYPRICDMTDTHLRNAIRCCKRLHRQMQRDLPYPMFGGEMAQYYAEQDYERFQESDPEESFPLYLDLHAEADRRGLKV